MKSSFTTDKLPVMQQADQTMPQRHLQRCQQTSGLFAKIIKRSQASSQQHSSLLSSSLCKCLSGIARQQCAPSPTLAPSSSSNPASSPTIRLITCAGHDSKVHRNIEAPRSAFLEACRDANSKIGAGSCKTWVVHWYESVGRSTRRHGHTRSEPRRLRHGLTVHIYRCSRHRNNEDSVAEHDSMAQTRPQGLRQVRLLRTEDPPLAFLQTVS